MVLNVEMWNNHIRQTKEMSLTVVAMEERLRSFPYNGVGLMKDKKVENIMLPPIALIFYSYLFETGTIPSDITLVEEYLKQPCFNPLPNDKVELNYNGKVEVLTVEGVSARVLRTYPSLVRDLHFYLLIKESGQFPAVRYSFKADYYDKVDLTVQYNDKWYPIGLMLGSKRSLYYKIKKVFRHKPIDTIDIELNPRDAVHVGDYHLYSKYHIGFLVEMLKSQFKTK